MEYTSIIGIVYQGRQMEGEHLLTTTYLLQYIVLSDCSSFTLEDITRRFYSDKYVITIQCMHRGLTVKQ